MIAITGNTYPVKDQIKALGGKWDANSKSWMVPDDKAEQARALVGAAPTKAKTYHGARTIDGVQTLGEYRARANHSQPCRKCDTYCYGDCEAN